MCILGALSEYNKIFSEINISLLLFFQEQWYPELFPQQVVLNPFHKGSLCNFSKTHIVLYFPNHRSRTFIFCTFQFWNSSSLVSPARFSWYSSPAWIRKCLEYKLLQCVFISVLPFSIGCKSMAQIVSITEAFSGPKTILLKPSGISARFPLLGIAKRGTLCLNACPHMYIHWQHRFTLLFPWYQIPSLVDIYLLM